jgi:hypothetical protein
MTLRVELKIIPHGAEDQAYEIFRLDIHNNGIVDDMGFGNVFCKYSGVLYKKSTQAMIDSLGFDEWEREDEFWGVIHNRRDGALPLVYEAIRKLENPKSPGEDY